MIVAKFGGSSVRDAQSMRNCAQIIECNFDICLVILSATYNTTNELDSLFSRFSKEGETDEFKRRVEALILRHRQLAQELLGHSCLELEEVISEFNYFIESWNEEIFKEEKNRDLTLSFGERFSSTLFFSYLSSIPNLKKRNIEFVKSYDYLKTDSSFGQAQFKSGSLASFANERFQPNRLYVAQGFIGSDEDGNITTLGREGSDYSAALFAEAISADEVFIWTDVAGVFSCDPRISLKAKVIDVLSYEQASLMAKYGAKVLYPETMEPLVRKRIKLWVKSTKDPKQRGTLISSEGCCKTGGYAICIENREDKAILTHLGEELSELAFPIVEKNDQFIRYNIDFNEVELLLEQILN